MSGPRLFGFGPRECGVTTTVSELGCNRVGAKCALEPITLTGAGRDFGTRTGERQRCARIGVAEREPRTREHPAIAIVGARTQRVDIDRRAIATRDSMTCLGERDVGADLRVGIAALGADSQGFAVTARGTSFVGQLATHITGDEQRERAQVRGAVRA